mgnify:CR=1 FL=1
MCKNAKMKYPPLGEFNSQDALNKLKEQQRIRFLFCIGILFALILGGSVISGLGLILTIRMRTQIRELDNVSNIINVMETLLDEFSHYNIEIIPEVEVPKETGIPKIDLFVRIPVEKVYFSICVRKMERSKVVFHREKQRLMIRRKGRRGLNPLNPDPIDFLGSSTTWIQKNKRSIFGRASNDRRRPCAKILCLVGSTEVGKSDEERYTIIGDCNFLIVRKDKNPIFLLHEKHAKNNLYRFIKNFIKANGKQESQKENQQDDLAKGKSKTASEQRCRKTLRQPRSSRKLKSSNR